MIREVRAGYTDELDDFCTAFTAFCSLLLKMGVQPNDVELNYLGVGTENVLPRSRGLLWTLLSLHKMTAVDVISVFRAPDWTLRWSGGLLQK